MQNIKKLSIYDVNPRYFKDRSGNGIGDFTGMAQKFDYFDYLGVDAIILQDVIASHVTGELPKFTSINKEVGDINGLQLVLSHAKKYGIKIFLEMKIGTITDKHTWFQNAIDNVNERGENIIEFANKKEEVGVDNTKYNREAKAYFAYDEKTKEIPLNWKSDEVIDRFVEVVKFWNDLGISGFVFKDFEYIGDKTKTELMNGSTLKDLRKFYRAIKEVNDNIVVIGKSGLIPLKETSSFTTGSTQVFDYFQSTKISTIDISDKYGADIPGKFRIWKLVSSLKTFATNPSNILSFGSETIGRFISRWGDDKQYRTESAKAFALLSFLTPSSTSIYYGDELGAKNIGLTHLDNFQDKTLEERKIKLLDMKVTEKEFMDAQVLQNPINARSLMMWNDKKNGGFSFSQQTVTPPSNEYAENNVELQFVDDNSILNFYKELNRMIHKSTFSSIVAKGEWKISQKISAPGVVQMKTINKNKELIVIINLTDSDRRMFNMPKEGKVILSTYSNKNYPELPNRLQAYEGIVISKHTDEFIKETQMIKLQKSKALAQAKLEKIKQEEIERLEIEREEFEKTQAIQLKKEEAAEKRAATIAAKKAEKLAKEEAEAAKKEEAIIENNVIEVELDDTSKKEAEKEAKRIEEEKEAIRLEKEKVRQEREAEKTRQFEIKQAEKEAKHKAKEEAKAAKLAEKTRQFEIKQAEKEEKAREEVAEKIDATETVVKKDVETSDDLFKVEENDESQKADEANLEAERKAEEDARETIRLEKEKAREEREAEKTKQFEIKLAEKEAKRKAKEEAKAAKKAEKSKLIELKQAARLEREAEKAAQNNASILDDEVNSSDITSLKESDIAPTTQIDVDDIEDIEEFLKNSK